MHPKQYGNQYRLSCTVKNCRQCRARGVHRRPRRVIGRCDLLSSISSTELCKKSMIACPTVQVSTLVTMPASTRSSTRQPKLEDLEGVEVSSKAASGRGAKRGVTQSKDGPRSSKKRRTDPKSEHSATPEPANEGVEPKESREEPDQGGSSSSQSITINRAPAQGKNEKRKRLAEKDDLDEIEVMKFHLRLKNGCAVVGEKGKKGNEVALKKKFGDAEYQLVKAAFEESLERWRGMEDELNEQAFHFYEEFRANVPRGQKGWGRKGQLNLQAVRSAVFPP
nr:hypothetical protein CFP56_04418 [Quercus suber]